MYCDEMNFGTVTVILYSDLRLNKNTVADLAKLCF